jgi:hypothetical protein
LTDLGLTWALTIGGILLAILGIWLAWKIVVWGFALIFYGTAATLNTLEDVRTVQRETNKIVVAYNDMRRRVHAEIDRRNGLAAIKTLGKLAHNDDEVTAAAAKIILAELVKGKDAKLAAAARRTRALLAVEKGNARVKKDAEIWG